MPKIDDVYESGNQLNVSGSNFKIEIDREDGTIYTRTEGAMIASHRDLSIGDFIVRYMGDFEQDQKYHKMVEWLEEHIDDFIDYYKLHEFRGDLQQRFRLEHVLDTNSEARHFVREWMGDHDIDLTPEIEDALIDAVEEDLWYMDSEDAFHSALEDVEQEVIDEVKNTDVETAANMDWMADIRERYREHLFEKEQEALPDMWAKLDEVIEEELQNAEIYRVQPKEIGDASGDWEVKGMLNSNASAVESNRSDAVDRAEEIGSNKDHSVIIQVLDESHNIQNAYFI